MAFNSLRAQKGFKMYQECLLKSRPIPSFEKRWVSDFMFLSKIKHKHSPTQTFPNNYHVVLALACARESRGAWPDFSPLPHMVHRSQKAINQTKAVSSTPPKTNMSPWKGTISIGNTSSNHRFSGDMLVIRRVFLATSHLWITWGGPGQALVLDQCSEMLGKETALTTNLFDQVTIRSTIWTSSQGSKEGKMKMAMHLTHQTIIKQVKQ